MLVRGTGSITMNTLCKDMACLQPEVFLTVTLELELLTFIQTWTLLEDSILLSSRREKHHQLYNGNKTVMALFEKYTD